MEVNSTTSMRIHWFEHVRKIRKKLTTARKQPVSHQDAMREASTTWPEKKLKIQKKQRREEKKLAKSKK